MPHVVFRCDASPAIGGGHVARCMALARALKARGATVELVTRDLPAGVRKLIVDPLEIRVRDLPPGDSGEVDDEGEALAHASWLPVSQRDDAQQIGDVLGSASLADWLVVDHYALDARWERAVRPLARSLLVIDDLADREHECDLLLDQNFFAEAERRYQSRVPSRTALLLGPRYALLRPDFALARRHRSSPSGSLKRVFVCFGGFDGARQATRALEGLERTEIPELQVDLVVGSDHPDRRSLEETCRRHVGWRMHLDLSNLAELMTSADLAIGASGIMNWERATLALPAIITSVAENQHVVARELAAERACVYLGYADQWDAETLAAWLKALSRTSSMLRALASRTGALTDGYGAERVARHLLPDEIVLRPAQASDCDAIHTWRNDPRTRQYSTNSEPVSLTVHRAWLERVLHENSTLLFIGLRNQSPVGVLRYDIDGSMTTVSIYLVPGCGGRGLGTALLHAGTRWLRNHRTDIRTIQARIHRDNMASLGAFRNAGYRALETTYTLDLST